MTTQNRGADKTRAHSQLTWIIRTHMNLKHGVFNRCDPPVLHLKKQQTGKNKAAEAITGSFPEESQLFTRHRYTGSWQECRGRYTSALYLYLITVSPKIQSWFRLGTQPHPAINSEVAFSLHTWENISKDLFVMYVGNVGFFFQFLCILSGKDSWTRALVMSVSSFCLVIAA